MFYKLSKFFLYASLFVPLVLVKKFFFPFIAGKAITFRILVELAVLFFLLHLLAHINNPDFYKRLTEKLKHPIVICVALLALTFTITALTGINPEQSFWSNFERGDGALQLLHAAAFFILAVLLFTDRKSIERLLIVNIFVSAPICIYAFLQLITPIDTNTNWFIVAPGDRVSGTLGNPSYLAAYLLFIMAFIIYFFIRYKDPIWRTVLGVLGSFELFIFLKTGTRGAFLGFVAAILLVAAINFLITKSKNLRMTLGALFIVGIVLIGSFFATKQSPVWENVPVLNRLINFNSAANDIKPRIWTWNSALAGVIEKPVAGWGAENFPLVFDKYYNPNHFGIESFFDRTHNIFLEYALSGGLLVLLPWLAIFYFYYQKLRARPKDAWYSILFVVPIAYLIQGFFLFDTLPIYIVLFTFLALAINTEGAEISLSPGKNADLKGVNVATAIVLVAGCAALIHYTAIIPIRKNLLIVNSLILQGQLAAEVAANGRSSVSPVQIINSFHKALDFYSPIGQEEAVSMYQKFMLGIVENASNNPQLTGSPQAREDMKKILNDANTIYDKHLALYPGLKQQFINGGINIRGGLAFRLPEYLERGRTMFLSALEKAPTRLEFIRVLIELAQRQNDAVSLDKWSRRANLYRPDLFPLVPAK